MWKTIPRPLRWAPRKPSKPCSTPSSAASSCSVTGPIARPRISNRDLADAPSWAISDSCLRLTSSAGRPAGVNRRAPSLDDRRRQRQPVGQADASCGARRDSSRSTAFIITEGVVSAWLLDDRQVAQHGVVEAEARLELVQHLVVALDVDAEVVRLGELLDHVRHLAPSPVLDPVHLAAAGGDEWSCSVPAWPEPVRSDPDGSRARSRSDA